MSALIRRRNREKKANRVMLRMLWVNSPSYCRNKFIKTYSLRTPLLLLLLFFQCSPLHSFICPPTYVTKLQKPTPACSRAPPSHLNLPSRSGSPWSRPSTRSPTTNRPSAAWSGTWRGEWVVEHWQGVKNVEKMSEWGVWNGCGSSLRESCVLKVT